MGIGTQYNSNLIFKKIADLSKFGTKKRLRGTCVLARVSGFNVINKNRNQTLKREIPSLSRRQGPALR